MSSAERDSNPHLTVNAKDDAKAKDVYPAAQSGESEGLTEHVGDYFVAGVLKLGHQFCPVGSVASVFHSDL